MAETPPAPDPMIATLQQHSAQLQAQAAALREAMGNAATEVSNDYVTLRVLGGRLLDVEFTDAVNDASPVQLRDGFRRLYAEGQARSVNASANLVTEVFGDTELAAGIRASAPPAAQEAADELRLPEERPRRVGDLPETAPEELDWESLLGAAEPLDPQSAVDSLVAELRADPEVARVMKKYAGSKPENWQAEFDAEVATLNRQRGRLSVAMEDARATVERPGVKLTVTGLGMVEDITFSRLRDTEADKLAEHVLAAYREAADQAAGQVSAALDTLTDQHDSPTRAYVAQLRADLHHDQEKA